MYVLPILEEHAGNTLPYCYAKDNSLVIHGVPEYIEKEMRLYTSAISGGNFCEYIKEITQDSKQCACLLLDPLQHRFSLPAVTGEGIKMRASDIEQLQLNYDMCYSEDLCCNYFYLPQEPSIVLFDSHETLQKKLDEAEKAGVYICIAAESIYKKLRLPENQGV